MRAFTLAGIFILVFYHSLLAQDNIKIGLTLSGGGAKGLAHIGILKAIDSSGLKIDYVTGTSMGSVIGSLYAIGYSADDIDSIARCMDWDVLLSNTPNLREISIEEKFEFNRYAAELPFEKGSVKIPSGIIEGQELWLKLFELHAPVYNIKDFNQFSIPFACIGTDIVNGKAVVLNKGELSAAVRSSMAIPSVFSPVHLDSLILVDGGVVRNFPVKDVKQMGADYVIGVNVGTPSLQTEEVKSFFDIMMQIMFFNDTEDMKYEKSLCSLYIQPDLKGYATGDFANGADIVDLGIEEGLKWYPYFKKLADSLHHYRDTTSRLPVVGKILISDIEIKGTHHTTDDFLLGRIGLTKGESYTLDEINQGVRKAYGTRYYKKILYAFETSENQSIKIKFDVAENDMTYIKLGIHYDSYTSFGIIGNITARNTLTRNSRFLWTFKIGEFPKSRLQYYQYLGKNRNWGLDISHYLEYTEQQFFDESYHATALYNQLYQHAEIKVQRILNIASLVGVGYRREFYNLYPKVDDNIYFKGSNNFNYAFAYFEFNSLNKKVFPTRGTYINFNAGYVFGQQPKLTVYENGQAIAESDTTEFFDSFGDYSKWTLELQKYSYLSPKSTFITQAYFGYIHQQDHVFFNEYIMGGIAQNNRNQFPVIGLMPGEVRSTSFATIQVAYQYELHKKLYLTPRLNTMVYDFYLDRESTLEWINGGGLSIGYASGIGPIEMTTMYSPEIGKVRAFVNIGFVF